MGNMDRVCKWNILSNTLCLITDTGVQLGILLRRSPAVFIMMVLYTSGISIKELKASMPALAAVYTQQIGRS